MKINTTGGGDGNFPLHVSGIYKGQYTAVMLRHGKSQKFLVYSPMEQENRLVFLIRTMRCFLGLSFRSAIQIRVEYPGNLVA